MNKIIGSLITVSLLIFTVACGGSSEESPYSAEEQQKTEAVTDSISIEMIELREDIEQTLDELERLLDEIE